MTEGYKGLQGYKRSQRVKGATGGYKGLQRVTEDYRGLQEVT